MVNFNYPSEAQIKKHSAETQTELVNVFIYYTLEKKKRQTKASKKRKRWLRFPGLINHELSGWLTANSPPLMRKPLASWSPLVLALKCCSPSCFHHFKDLLQPDPYAASSAAVTLSQEAGRWRTEGINTKGGSLTWPCGVPAQDVINVQQLFGRRCPCVCSLCVFHKNYRRWWSIKYASSWYSMNQKPESLNGLPIPDLPIPDLVQIQSGA